jgi:Ca2+-binding RTX toxin-like protein
MNNSSVDSIVDGGADILNGQYGDDTLYGDALNLFGSSIGGNDQLFGGAGNDVIYGDALQITSGARGGSDTLNGGAGNDDLWGDANDASRAVGRDDVLIGGAGNDEMWGGGGNDTFVIGVSHGWDTIYDFKVAGEQDKIDLSAFNFADFDDINIGVNPYTGTARIYLPQNSFVDLVNVAPSQLSEVDFIL